MDKQGKYRVLLFGTGCKCLDFIKKIDAAKVQIIAFIDNNAALHGEKFQDKRIISPQELADYEYDYVIIVTRFFEEAAAQLLALGVALNKIVGPYLVGEQILSNHNRLISEFVIPQATGGPDSDQAAKLPPDSPAKNEDCNRLSSLKLAAEQIYDGQVSGSVAELGVYRGDFARYINEFFPDRKIYLFDTFAGFAAADIEVEQRQRFSNSQINEFANTSVEMVLAQMKFPELCIVKKGYFPATAHRLEEQFAFVSIDADLYNPIYHGLEFFYPRLAKGGYIFVHDVNNLLFKGARAAIRRYCRENGISYFPLNDMGGTAVITK